MRFSLAIFLFTIGAILKFAVKADGDPVDINAIGVIFMIMGVVTLALQYLPPRRAGVDPEIVPHIERPVDGVVTRDVTTRTTRDVID